MADEKDKEAAEDLQLTNEDADKVRGGFGKKVGKKVPKK